MVFQRYRKDPRVTTDRTPDPSIFSAMKRMDQYLEVEWFNVGRHDGECQHFRIYRKIGDVACDVMRTPIFGFETLAQLREMDRYQSLDVTDRKAVVRQLQKEVQEHDQRSNAARRDRQREQFQKMTDRAAVVASSGIHSDAKR